MRAVTWLIVSALCGIACGADPIAVPVTPSLVTPSPGPVFVPVPAYLLEMFITTMGTQCSGCVVEITNGPGAGASATTAQGRATLVIPVSGTVTVRTSKARYRPTMTTVTVDKPSISAYVSLASEGPTIDLTGARLLEVRADAGCQLAAELQVRTYPVSLVTSEPGSWFRAHAVDDVFKDFFVSVGVSIDEAAFFIENSNTDEDGIIERLQGGSTLRIQMSTGVVPVANRDAISTASEGRISYCDASSKCTAVCTSKTHQLTLTRR